MLDEVEVKSSFDEEDERGTVFLSDSEGDKDFVEVNEHYLDSDPDDPDTDESDSDDWPKQPPPKKSKKLVMDGREKAK